jgi:hypothetical protein
MGSRGSTLAGITDTLEPDALTLAEWRRASQSASERGGERTSRRHRGHSRDVLADVLQRLGPEPACGRFPRRRLAWGSARGTTLGALP